MLRLDKKTYKNIFNIGYVTVKNIGSSSGHSINSVNPLYLRIDNGSRYIAEKESNKCLIFDSTDENKELLKIYSCVFDGLIDEIRKINDDWLEYTKDRLNRLNSIQMKIYH